ncbi:MAG: hypothetical protein QXS41_00980 [Candidatus Woesearchaeota archaeon]
MPKKRTFKENRTKEENDKKKFYSILTLIIGFIMIFSSFAWIFLNRSEDNTNTIQYNNFVFQYNQNERKFYTKVNNKLIKTFLDPTRVEHYNLTFTRTPKISLTFKNLEDDEIDAAKYYLQDLINLMHLDVNLTISEIEDCSNLNLVIDKEFNEVKQDKNCIYLPFDSSLVEVSDFIVFRYFNIIK